MHAMQASIWEKQAQLDEEQMRAVEALAGIVSQRPLPAHVRLEHVKPRMTIEHH